MTNLPLKFNRIQCNRCLDVIESTHQYDFKWCKCKSVAVDGGLLYLRRIGNQEDYTELAEWFSESELRRTSSSMEEEITLVRQ